MKTRSRLAISVIPLLFTNVACSGNAYEIGRAFPESNSDGIRPTGNGSSGAAGYVAGSSGLPAVGGTGAGGTAAATGGRPGTGSGAAAGMSAMGGASGVAGAGAAGSGGTGVGAAGSGGTGGTGGTVTGCTLRVPQDYKTISAAVAAATVAVDASPAVVCVDPGTYEFQDTIYRDGVSLRGTGPGVVLCNALQGLGLGLTPSGSTTTIENFDIPYGVYIEEYTDLTLRNLRVGSGLGPLGCDPNAQHGGGSGTVQLKTAEPAEVHLDIERVTLFSPDMNIDRHLPTSTVVYDTISISSSSCVVAGKFISLYLETDPNVPTPSDSRVDVDISNNLSVDTTGAGIQIFGGAMPANLIATSRVEVRNNTIISKGDSGYGIAFQVTPQFPTPIVANNVVSYMSQPFFAGNAKPTLAGNSFSQKPDSEPWFADWSNGDFHPAAGSPLIGAADMRFSPAVDIDGSLRQPAPDVGAFQHRP